MGAFLERLGQRKKVFAAVLKKNTETGKNADQLSAAPLKGVTPSVIKGFAQNQNLFKIRTKIGL